MENQEGPGGNHVQETASLGEVIVITDPDGSIQYVNPAFQKVTGYGPEEARGQNPRILKSGKQDELYIKSDSPPVIADPTQVHQIMMNFCTNALHAIEDEHGIISVSLDSVTVDKLGHEKTEEPQTGEYVRLVVSDTGKGMPQEIQERIFEPYIALTQRPRAL